MSIDGLILALVNNRLRFRPPEKQMTHLSLSRSFFNFLLSWQHQRVTTVLSPFPNACAFHALHMFIDQQPCHLLVCEYRNSE